MTLKPVGRVVKASILSLAMALGATACSNDYTVSYVYMTTSKSLPHGLINGYQVDYQSGYLRPLADSPIDAGGRNTVGLVVAPSNLFLYTVNNFDSNVVEFAIGTDGKLYPENTYNIAGSLPTAAAIDAAGKFLYVTFTYQNNPNGSQQYSPANPGPGGISVFPIKSDNTLGTPFTVNVGRNPVGIATSTVGNYVYVIEADSASSANLLGFTENTTSGALTPMAGVTINPGNVASTGFPSGANPTGILEDKSGTHLYVTDQSLNQVAAYTLAGGIPALAGTTPTDATPDGNGVRPQRQVSLCSGVHGKRNRLVHAQCERSAGAVDRRGQRAGRKWTNLRDRQRGSQQRQSKPCGVSIHIERAEQQPYRRAIEFERRQPGPDPGHTFWRQPSAHMRGNRAGSAAAMSGKIEQHTAHDFQQAAKAAGTKEAHEFV